MARSDYTQFTPRRPRHPVTEAAAIDVSLERSGQEPSCLVAARLLDFSREGFRLRVPVRLTVQEAVTVRIRSENDGIDLALPGTVRWQRPDGDAAWLVGCAATRPADWETLGELFLHKILSTEPLPRS